MRRQREDDDLAGGPDPSRFFRSLAGEEPPEEFWAGFWPSVRAGIREAENRPAGILTLGRALLLGSSAGLMAAAAVLVAAFLVVPVRRAPEPGKPPAVAEAARPGSPLPGGEAPSPPVMEDLRSASARVYTFRVGGPADSTDVILIVDESLDI